MYFDTHTHLDDEKFDPDRELVIENLKKEGVSLAVNVGADLTSSKNSIALAEQYDFIYAAVGVHPNEVGEMQDEDLETLADMAKHEKVVAIGEIGLDYHYDEPGRDVQKLWFEKQLHLAQALNMPFIVHDRDAHQDTLELLKKVGYYNGVMHCFSGSCEMAKILLDLGFYISIAGQVTFKNAPKVKEVAKMVPADRLFIETDSPYLTPEPHRGERNNSANVKFTCAKIAELKGICAEELAKVTLENGKKFYGIR
ncbi:TatD family hydrolase [Congzhengia minquanensis]|uniref:TatD family hydrolase n=1 Tax=Congzhengia minquanensis TaxID=2763657 RepID=A0A926DLS2_9FIRM|nr:TatD family hydrolase [Congzhengia minquanensis]MBC8541313.1 TatD family hydrolase [Congzhengia minquanensis]